MPVAVPYAPERPTLDSTEAEDFDDTQSEYLSEEEDDELEYDVDADDDEDEFEEFNDVSIGVNGIFFPLTAPRASSNPEASQDPFNEYFSYQEARGLGNGQCLHQSSPNHRHCRHCPAKFSSIFYSSCQLMHQSIFGDKTNFKRLNPLYTPNHPSAIERFKAITAMHDPVYIRRLFEEIVHYVCFLQNQQIRDGKAEQNFKTKLFWLYEFIERLFLCLQEQMCTEELVLIGTFRAQLKAIGLCSRFDENVQVNRRSPYECHR